MGRHAFLHFSRLQLKQISRASNQTHLFKILHFIIPEKKCYVTNKPVLTTWQAQFFPSHFNFHPSEEDVKTTLEKQTV